MSNTLDSGDNSRAIEPAAEPGDALREDEDLLTDTPGESDIVEQADPEVSDLDNNDLDNGDEATEQEFSVGDAPVTADGQAADQPGTVTASTTARFPDIAALSYEDARDQLVGVVQRLESGQAPLDETMNLWERGEALAEHCSQWLHRAEQRLEQSAATRTE